MSKSNWCLYRHTSPSGKVYIGITSQKPENRWNHGKVYMNVQKGPFRSTIIKYGWDNIKHEVLFNTLSEEQAKHLEVELIRHYKKLGVSLNITNGGNGMLGITPWNKGQKVPYEKSNKLKGCHLSEAHKKKLREAHKGKHIMGHKWTKAQREKIIKQKTGTHVTKETREKISKHSAKARKVLEYNTSGILIAEFPTARVAAHTYGINESWVARACRTKVFCVGHLFAYADTKVQPSSIKYGRHKAGKSITVCNINTGEEYTFHSLSTCARFIGVKSVSSIRKAIQKERSIKTIWSIRKG